MIKELIDTAIIIEELENSEKSAALREVLAVVGEQVGMGDKELTSLTRRLFKRERLGSTGIGNGVAVPHVKGKTIDHMRLVLARSPAGIEYQAIDGQDVKTIFLILAPEGEAEKHLQALRWISILARDADFRRFVLVAKGPDEIRDLLFEMGERLAP
ncbi:MAG: PTS sugar transporter subunit IIA [Planctomycetota bacterium]|jgi:mannitol/fructose-specific phosphotransferase system IIA component (Ntr-type)|nr:PTS sugar transporter subunit IIA [Planctomycetota bacterium]